MFQTAVSTALFLSLLWPTTTGAAASKFVARASGRDNGIERAAVAAHLRLRTAQAAVVLAGLTIPVWWVVDQGSLTESLCVAALVVGLAGYNFTRGYQYGAGRIQPSTWWDICAATAGALGVIALLYLGVRDLRLLLPIAGCYFIFTAACWPWFERGATRTCAAPRDGRLRAVGRGRHGCQRGVPPNLDGPREGDGRFTQCWSVRGSVHTRHTAGSRGRGCELGLVSIDVRGMGTRRSRKLSGPNAYCDRESDLLHGGCVRSTWSSSARLSST